MVSKTTKYERIRTKRFARRDAERRDRVRRLLNQDPLCDIYEPWAHALTNLIHELTLIERDTIRVYLNDHNEG